MLIPVTGADLALKKVLYECVLFIVVTKEVNPSVWARVEASSEKGTHVSKDPHKNGIGCVKVTCIELVTVADTAILSPYGTVAGM